MHSAILFFLGLALGIYVQGRIQAWRIRRGAQRFYEALRKELEGVNSSLDA